MCLTRIFSRQLTALTTKIQSLQSNCRVKLDIPQGSNLDSLCEFQDNDDDQTLLFMCSLRSKNVLSRLSGRYLQIKYDYSCLTEF